MGSVGLVIKSQNMFNRGMFYKQVDTVSMIDLIDLYQ